MRSFGPREIYGKGQAAGGSSGKVGVLQFPASRLAYTVCHLLALAVLALLVMASAARADSRVEKNGNYIDDSLDKNGP